MKKPIIILAIALLLAGACTVKKTVESSDSISEEKTKEILQHHWEAFQANDMEATLADYTEESVLITPDKTFKGLAEIRQNFEFAFSIFPKDSTTLTLNKSIVAGDVGYIIWEAKAPKLSFSFGTDTFIIRDGKIIRQTFAGVVANPQ
jgi:hypothetical protein